MNDIRSRSSIYIEDYAVLINQQLKRGRKSAARKQLAGQLLILMGAITGIALTILFHPYGWIAVTPLLGYGIHNWTKAIEIRTFCEKEASDLEHLTDCDKAIKILFRLNFKDRSMVTKQQIEDQLVIIKSCEEQISKYQSMYLIEPSEEMRTFKEKVITCQEAFNIIFPADDEKIDEHKIQVIQQLFRDELTPLSESICGILKNNSISFTEYLDRKI